MDFNICVNHSAISSETSLHLNHLRNILENDYDLSVQVITINSEAGVKDGGLTIALNIIGVSISAIATIISALSYWGSQHKKYSISVKSKNKNFTIDKSGANDFQDIVLSLKNESTLSKIEISISENDI